MTTDLSLGRVVEAALGEEAVQNGIPETTTSTPDSPRDSTSNHKSEFTKPVGSETDIAKTDSHASDDEAIGEKPSPEAAAAEDEGGLLTGFKLYAVFGSLMMCVFMFALDQSIVATAIPVIVSQFDAFSMVAWVITAYFLTQCGLILLVGQTLTLVKPKWMLLAAVFFFELGSLLCAVSNGMTMLIISRAIQGIGASGMFVSILATIAIITTLKQRPIFMASFGFVFVISSIIGPLLGGVFTQRATWRWCFWINLFFGGIAAVAVILLLPARDPIRASDAPKGRQAFKQIDFVGSALIMIVVVCLLLALQWGGNQYAWNSWRIILLFTLGGVLAIAFALWEYWLNETALIPRALLQNRTELGACGTLFFLMCAMLGGTYQLPLFYQATRHASPEKSGIDIIPFMVSVCVGIFIQGGTTAKTGRYYPFPPIGSAISAVGFGLLYTVNEHTANAKIIGFQILAGIGIGLAFQAALIGVQAEYSDRPHLISQATGVVSFFQLTGAALGVGIINTVQSVYLNRLLKQYAPEAPFEVVRESVQAIWTLPEELQPQVVHAYTASITKSFIPIYLAIALAFICGLFLKNHNILTKGGPIAAGAV